MRRASSGSDSREVFDALSDGLSSCGFHLRITFRHISSKRGEQTRGPTNNDLGIGEPSFLRLCGSWFREPTDEKPLRIHKPASYLS